MVVYAFEKLFPSFSRFFFRGDNKIAIELTAVHSEFGSTEVSRKIALPLRIILQIDLDFFAFGMRDCNR